MASSQVEIAAFGCGAVHNRRDPFQKSLNKFMAASCNDTSRRIDLEDLWVHQPQWKTTTAAATNKCSSGNNNNTNNNNNNKKKKEEESSIAVEAAETRTNRWARAREMIFPPVDNCDSTKGSSGGGRRSLGVSSLVQKWSSRSNGGGGMPAVENEEEEAEAGMDPFGDWEPARNAFSAPASSRGRDSDATESERLRVADIIRKLTDDVGGCESPPRARTPSASLDQIQTEQRCSAAVPVLSSPRIRGRQAYNDVLMQMERDRKNELQRLGVRKPVSNFSHRGRIQAMLRFRFLHRKEGRLSNTTSSSHKPPPIPSPAREKVHPVSQNGPVHSGNCSKELIDHNTHATSRQENLYNEETSSSTQSYLKSDHIQDSITSSQNRDADDTSHKVDQDVQYKVDLLHSCETSPSHTNSESGDPSLEAKSVEAAIITFQNKDVDYVDSAKSVQSEEEEEATNANHHVTETKHDFGHEEGESASTDDQIVEETCMYWVSDVSHPEAGWQELHSDYQQQEGSNREWIDEVSRPRSDWEDLRQARYQEMLDPFADNEEIRVLLGRKSVSTFLSSSLRDKIDQLMISRTEGQESVKNNNETEEEKYEQLAEQEQSVVSEVSDEREGEEDTADEEGQEYVVYFDEYDESSVGQQYNESDDNTTSSPPTSWPQKSQDLSDYSYQAPSPSTQPSPSNYYSQDNGTTPSFAPRPAIEMELIYDLRGHMEQLHQEMAELRKSIKCCMDMQIQLQRSIKKEVAVAQNHHSDAKNGGRNSVKRVTSVGKCVVCCKMQVDSLLYRCGHMCTCFKCAHELQWSSGKCPICRAPIVDVVRTYSNDSPS